MGKDIKHILDRLHAKAANQPTPHDSRIVQHLVKASAGPMPMANVLLKDAIPPKTEWELAIDNDLPPAKVNGKGRDLRKPYVWKGEVGQPQKLSELSTEELDLAGQREGDARIEDEQPYKGTPQERIAISHIKAKIVRKKPLTNAEKKLWGKFTMAKLVARAGLNRRQA